MRPTKAALYRFVQLESSVASVPTVAPDADQLVDDIVPERLVQLCISTHPLPLRPGNPLYTFDVHAGLVGSVRLPDTEDFIDVDAVMELLEPTGPDVTARPVLERAGQCCSASIAGIRHPC